MLVIGELLALLSAMPALPVTAQALLRDPADYVLTVNDLPPGYAVAATAYISNMEASAGDDRILANLIG
jgi:hypothetical protein